MATIGTITETTVGSTIYDPMTKGMIAGKTFTRRHYTVSSYGEDFTVQSVYADGEYDLVVSIHGGRDFLVGSEETPTIDAAVEAAVTAARPLGLTVGIVEHMTTAAHCAQVDRTDAQNAADWPLSTMPR